MENLINTINENKYYGNQVMRITESDFDDLYCKGNTGFCTFQSSKFPSKKYKDKNFKYILSEISQGIRRKPRQKRLKTPVLV